MKLFPVIVTEVPPVVGPAFGLVDVTAGAAMYVNNEFELLNPPAVVTTTLAVPARPREVTAVIVESLTTTTLVAGDPPNITPVAPVKPVPIMVTGVPPPAGPEGVVMASTVGGGT